MPIAERLSREEDAELRRLHFFEVLGARLSEDMHELKESLRGRDTRDDIREPEEAVQVLPPAPRPAAD